MVKNLPANARDMGSIPGLGGSHMPRSNWAREPQLLSLSLWSLCSAIREAAILRGLSTAMKSGPPLTATGESPSIQTKTNIAINQSINLKTTIKNKKYKIK